MKCLKTLFNKKSFLPLGHWIKSPRTSTSAFVTWRKQRVTLNMVTPKRSDFCLQLSWFARAQTATAICLCGWIQGFPNLLALGMWSLADSKRLSISKVDEVMRKWLLKTSQWLWGTVDSKYRLILAHFRRVNKQQLESTTNVSSWFPSKRDSSSSGKRKSETTCGHAMLQICPASA